MFPLKPLHSVFIILIPFFIKLIIIYFAHTIYFELVLHLFIYSKIKKPEHVCARVFKHLYLKVRIS